MKYTLITQSEKSFEATCSEEQDEYKLLHVELVKGDQSKSRNDEHLGYDGIDENHQDIIHQAYSFDVDIDLTDKELKVFHEELLVNGIDSLAINFAGEIDCHEHYSAIDAFCDDVPENVIRMMYEFATFSDIYSREQLDRFFSKLKAA